MTAIRKQSELDALRTALKRADFDTDFALGMVDRLVAREAQLEEALRPFAEIADKLDADWTSGNRYLDGDFTRVRIEAGKFRAARVALEGK